MLQHRRRSVEHLVDVTGSDADDAVDLIQLRRQLGAPMKPIPETIWAATREGSSTTVFSSSTSKKPYLLISMKRAEPRPTRV
jgi:hypothetical protein